VEGWQMSLKKVLWFRAKLILRLLSFLYPDKWLPGNHDYLPFAAFFPSTYKRDGVIAEHGNRFDIYNREPNTCIGRVVAKIVGFLERAIHPDLDDWLSPLLEMKKVITPASPDYPGDFSEYERGAETLLDQNPDCDVAILGHTHDPVLKRVRNGIYGNCGRGWSGKMQPTFLRVTSQKVELVDGLTFRVLKKIDR